VNFLPFILLILENVGAATSHMIRLAANAVTANPYLSERDETKTLQRGNAAPIVKTIVKNYFALGNYVVLYVRCDMHYKIK